jgi:hypothetical protein
MVEHAQSANIAMVLVIMRAVTPSPSRALPDSL